MSAYLVERIGRHPLIEVRLRTQVTELHADGDRLGGHDRERRRRDGALAVARAVPLHRRRAAHRVGRRAGVRTDAAGYILTGPDLLDGRAAPGGLAARSRPARAGDQRPRPLRRGRRAPRLHQTGGGSGRRGRDGHRPAHRRLEELRARPSTHFGGATVSLRGYICHGVTPSRGRAPACAKPHGSFRSQTVRSTAGSCRALSAPAAAERRTPDCAHQARPATGPSRRWCSATSLACWPSAGTCSARRRTPRTCCRRFSPPRSTRCWRTTGRSTPAHGYTGSPATAR